MQNVILILEGVAGKVTQNGNLLKAHTKELTGSQLSTLSELHFSPNILDVKVKRSGTGITILVECDF